MTQQKEGDWNQHTYLFYEKMQEPDSWQVAVAPITCYGVVVGFYTSQSELNRA